LLWNVIETAVKKTVRWTVFRRGVSVSAEANRAITAIFVFLITTMKVSTTIALTEKDEKAKMYLDKSVKGSVSFER